MHIWNLVELDTYKEGEREEADKDFREPSLDPFSNGSFFLFGMAFNDMLRLEGPPPTPWLAIFNFKIPINNQKNHTQLSPNIKLKKKTQYLCLFTEKIFSATKQSVETNLPELKS